VRTPRRPARLARAAPLGLTIALAAAAHPVPAAAEPRAQAAWPTGISADGQVVTFGVAEYVRGTGAFFVYFARDLAHDRTVPLGFSVADASGGAGSAAPVSADNRYAAVSIASAADPLIDQVVEVDLDRQAPVLVSATPSGRGGNGSASQPTISADGRYVAFASTATDLAPGDSNGDWDVFARDVATGTTRQVSVGRHGEPGNGPSRAPSISADGRYVAFSSDATNLVTGDTNGDTDVFVRDLRSGSTRRISLGPAGRQASQGSGSPSISADGRYVAFSSGAGNLVSDDTNAGTDVFVRDLRHHTTHRASLDSRGRQGGRGEYSFGPSISADGRYLAFISQASNLVPPGSALSQRAFVRDLRYGSTRLASRTGDGDPAGSPSWDVVISGNGRYLAFSSLRPAGPSEPSVFVRDLWTHRTRWIDPESD